MVRQHHWSSKSMCCSIVSWSNKPLVEAIGHDLVKHNLSINWSCSALISRVSIVPSDSNPVWLSSASGYCLCWHFLRFNVVTSWFGFCSLWFTCPQAPYSTCSFSSTLWNLRCAHLGLFTCYIVVLGAGTKSVNTGVVIGNELDSQIFELSQLALWKIGTRQLCL